MTKRYPTAIQLSNMLASTELKLQRQLAGFYPHDNCLHDKFYLDPKSPLCDCRKCEKNITIIKG